MHFVSRILNLLFAGHTNWQETATLTENLVGYLSPLKDIPLKNNGLHPKNIPKACYEAIMMFILYNGFTKMDLNLNELHFSYDFWYYLIT